MGAWKNTGLAFPIMKETKYSGKNALCECEAPSSGQAVYTASSQFNTTRIGLGCRVMADFLCGNRHARFLWGDRSNFISRPLRDIWRSSFSQGTEDPVYRSQALYTPAPRTLSGFPFEVYLKKIFTSFQYSLFSWMFKNIYSVLFPSKEQYSWLWAL